MSWDIRWFFPHGKCERRWVWVYATTSCDGREIPRSRFSSARHMLCELFVKMLSFANMDDVVGIFPWARKEKLVRSDQLCHVNQLAKRLLNPDTSRANAFLTAQRTDSPLISYARYNVNIKATLWQGTRPDTVIEIGVRLPCRPSGTFAIPPCRSPKGTPVVASQSEESHVTFQHPQPRHQGGEMVRKRMLLHRCIHSSRYHLQIMPDMLWSCAEQMEGDLKILPLHYSSQLFVYKFVLQFGTSVNPFQPRSFMVSDSTCCTCSHSSPVFFLKAEIRPLVELS